MEQNLKEEAEPTRWECVKCKAETWGVNPDWPCHVCRTERPWKMSGSTTASPEKKSGPSVEEEGYEGVLFRRCHEIQDSKVYRMWVTVATSQRVKILTVPASWDSLRRKLEALIEKFRCGNVLEGRTVHLSGGLNLEKPDHKKVWGQIGAALLEIVDMVRDLLGDETHGGLVAALYGAGFMDELFGYIAKPSCNENGAARLKKALGKISFTDRG